MGISETKKQIVIDNYFKNTCDVNTSIKEAFTKGFEVGLTKAVFPKDQYEARLKADMVAVLDKIRAEIEQNAYPIVHGVNNHEKGMTLYGILQVIDKYKAEKQNPELFNEKQDMMPKVYTREIADVLADVIEDFLESKGVEIPNPEKDEDNNDAILYGSDYSEITDNIIQTLRNFGIDVRNTYNLEEDLKEDTEIELC